MVPKRDENNKFLHITASNQNDALGAQQTNVEKNPETKIILSVDVIE